MSIISHLISGKASSECRYAEFGLAGISLLLLGLKTPPVHLHTHRLGVLLNVAVDERVNTTVGIFVAALGCRKRRMILGGVLVSRSTILGETDDSFGTTAD